MVVTKESKHVTMDQKTQDIIENARKSGESFSSALCRLIQEKENQIKLNSTQVTEQNQKIDEIYAFIKSQSSIPTMSIKPILEEQITIEQTALKHLDVATNESELAAVLGISPTAANQILKNLYKQNLLVKIGESYRKKNRS